MENNPQALSSFAKQRVVAIYASNVVVNVRFESGQQLVVDSRGGGTTQVDVRLVGADGKEIDLIGRQDPGPYQFDIRPLAEDGAEDPLFPKSDWRYEVANGDTGLGYQGWLEHRLECHEIEGALAEGGE